jgi:hypothetical protein
MSACAVDPPIVSAADRSAKLRSQQEVRWTPVSLRAVG